MHIAGIRLAEVALGIDERTKQGFVAARETDHRLIDRSVAVRVQPHSLTNDVRGLRARAGEQVHLIHCIEQLAVRRLEAVDLRNRAGEDDAHRVGHIVDLERIDDRLFDDIACVGNMGVQQNVVRLG